MKRLPVIITCLVLTLGAARPVQAALPVEEGGLLAGGEAYEINADTQGGLWISDWGLLTDLFGQVWRVNSSTGGTVIYEVPGLPTDARRDGSHFWWVDGIDGIIGRAEVGADGTTAVTYSTWDTSAIYGHYGSAVDAQGRLWATDALDSFIYRLNVIPGVNNDELCTYTIPSSGLTSYLAYGDPFLWIGDNLNGVLYRLNVTNNAVEWWTLPDLSSPNGMVVDAEGDLWYADYILEEILEVDPDLNTVRRYSLPVNHTTIMISIELGRIWFTGGSPPMIGMINPNTASFTSFPSVHGSGDWTPTCIANVEPAVTGDLVVRTTTIQFQPPTEYPVDTLAPGLQIYAVPPDTSSGTPIDGIPWGIAYQNGKMWVVDSGRQKLVAVTAPSEIVLSLEKTATESSYDAVGDIIHYSYELTNIGSQPILAPFTITDDKTNDEACPNSPASLAQGESITCTASYSITQADLNAGSVTNTAQGHAFIGAAPIDSNQDSETVTGVQTKVLSLEKSAIPLTYDNPGDVISYSYELTNGGNVTLSGPFTVSDDKAADESCPAIASLAPGAFITCSASYTITQADLDAGSVTNSATGHGIFNAAPVNSNQDSATVSAVQSKVLTLKKTALPLTYDSVGDLITYSFELTNGGNVTLSGTFTVSDDKAADEACPATASLAPGAFITCTATYTVTQADLDAGSVTNIAAGHAMFGITQVNSNSDTETVTAVQSPALSLTKVATPETYDSVGDVISYSYLVKNTGNVTLAGPVTVTDDKAVVTCPAGGLAPAAEKTCTASYTITQADLDAGTVTNTAQAHANGVNSNIAEETVTANWQPPSYQVFLPLVQR